MWNYCYWWGQRSQAEILLRLNQVLTTFGGTYIPRFLVRIVGILVVAFWSIYCGFLVILLVQSVKILDEAYIAVQPSSSCSERKWSSSLSHMKKMNVYVAHAIRATLLQMSWYVNFKLNCIHLFHSVPIWLHISPHSFTTYMSMTL